MTTEDILIPAECLLELGGCVPGDGAIECAERASLGYDWLQFTNEPYYGDTLVMEGSHSALLRVLARSFGLDVSNGVSWCRAHRLRVGYGGGQRAGIPNMDSYERRFVKDLSEGEARMRDRRGMENLWVTVPTIEREMSRLRSIAEAFVWVARLNRFRNSKCSDELVVKFKASDSDCFITFFEESYLLQRWRVEVK